MAQSNMIFRPSFGVGRTNPCLNLSFVNSLKLFGIGYSWGGYSSLAVYNEPAEMGDRRFFKIEKNHHLVRLHVGLEDTNDLINDLKNALRRVKS